MMCLLCIGMAQSSYCQHPRECINFDFDWKFYLGDIKNAMSPQYPDADWQKVQLPHDWSIALPVDKKNGVNMGFFPGGIGWYRKSFEVPAAYKGQKVYIRFDGVYHQSDVYINGKHLGFYPYGYMGFEYDITPHLKYGEKNVLAVRVNHSDSPSSRWYSGSGIYRHVWLSVTNPVHISTWGTYVTTPRINEKEAGVDITTSIENHSKQKADMYLETTIKDASGTVVASTRSFLSIQAKGRQEVKQQMQIVNPALWSVDSPYLYIVESVLKSGEQLIDKYHTPLGIRYFNFDPDKGFFLNGKPMKMKGVNLHQDAGALGAAVPDRAYERRLEILKEYGCNAIRCSHNPPSPEFLDLCDRLGFLVIDEAFDKWKSGYYAQYFDTWWKKDLDGMLRRDRNHPSVVIWSIGNELVEQDDPTTEARDRARMLQDYVHLTEPTRPVMLAIAPGKLDERTYNRTGFASVTDILGYNYQEPWYLDDKKEFPERIMFGSEVFPYFRGRKENIRGYFPINPWYDIQKEFIFGQFIWAGVDYLGESSGWPSKGWATSPFNTCMFEKPFAAFFRAVWSDTPSVNIAVIDQSLDIDPGKDHWSWPFMASHWNFPQYANHIIQIQTMTNCEGVELFINNQSMGRRNTADYPNNTITWYVPYKAGKIEAKGYNKELEAATCTMQTAGKPQNIQLSADRNRLTCDGQDLSHITVSIVDDKGVVVPDDDRMLTVEVVGEGRLLGVDNGDLRNHQAYTGNTLSTYWGKMLIVAQSSRTAGDMKVKVKSAGLPDAELIVKTENKNEITKKQ